MRKLVEEGVTIGGHSHTHEHMPNLSIEEIKNEIEKSNKNLAISTLCLVGLKPDDLNFLKMSIFFTFFNHHKMDRTNRYHQQVDCS